ncbi:MAG: group II intron maturase-specific domain-containing protein [Desulfuromonadaceae bacterium]|nr:group II intron maturase-specific domain-containing protein [Desulfuromonadaceae bacterium]
MSELNATVRGWVCYFHYRNSISAQRKLRYHLEERMTAHLRKRHKVRNWNPGYVKFPRKTLYER